jgi:hypothetical protein
MPPMAQLLATQRSLDAEVTELYPNTMVPMSWEFAGNLSRPLPASGHWTASGLDAGETQWHVYKRTLTVRSYAVVYADALGRLLSATKRWRIGVVGAPAELDRWVVGPRANTLDSELAIVEETAYNGRRERTDPERIAALREQRQQQRQAEVLYRREARLVARQAELVQRRQARQQRAADARAAARAEQAGVRGRQQAVRAVARLGQEAGATEAAVGAAMEAVANIGRTNATPAAAAPAIDLASAWAFLQTKIPSLIAAQEAAADTNNECVVCMSAPATMAFTACGHAVTCAACTERCCSYGNHRCPICRSHGGVLRLHFA